MQKTLYLFLAILPFASSTVMADGILISWGPQTLEGMTEDRWEAAKTRSVKQILALNQAVQTWPEAYEVLLGANQKKDDAALLRGLVQQVTDKTDVTLKHTSRLIIWERIMSGDIFFEGKGLQVDDDLYTVAGRANWVLRTITGKRFGIVRPKLSPDDLAQIQARWMKYLNSEPVEETPERYPSDKKGLEELRSPEAIHALITSLKPSDQKTQYTKRLLRDLYDLKELPKEPGHPALLCNPDNYTHGHLARITDVPDVHSHEWWSAWWSANKDNLVWNREKARFEVAVRGTQFHSSGDTILKWA